jgi:hypothetical protein
MWECFVPLPRGDIKLKITSSNGQTYFDAGNGDRYITTIWSVTCDGLVTAGIIGGLEFQFTINNNGDVVATTFFPTLKRVRDIPIPSGFYISPQKAPTPTVVLRCPAGQHATNKNPPKPLYSDGCGNEQTGRLPQLDFNACCNGHDVCFGTSELHIFLSKILPGRGNRLLLHEFLIND